MKRQYYIAPLLVAAVYGGTLMFSSFRHAPAGSCLREEGDTVFAGSLACRPCHKAIYDSFVLTAHNLASELATGENIKGSFDSASNEFKFNQLASVRMVKEGKSFFQVAYLGGAEFRKERIDMVVGSGRKGQTYLYWKDSLLFQDPISYYTPADCWCNSPGYPKNGPYFDRVTNARCLECHGSYAAVLPGSSYDLAFFRPKTIIYGVGCERCHGSGVAHVEFHTAHPEDKVARFILGKNELSRKQKLDVCGLCHTGIGVSLQPAFSFKAGDSLGRYLAPRYNPDTAAMLDVHGNQYGLLSSSKCFLNSQMTCSSCHNVHQTEINQPGVYSERCMTCHNAASGVICTVKVPAGFVLSDNCIDCHMPVRPSRAIFLQLADNRKSTPDFVRTHRVAIYLEKSEEIITKFKLKNGVAAKLEKKNRYMVRKY